MVANLNSENGKVSFAFDGDRADIWHKTGQQGQQSWTREQWLNAANMNYQTIKVQAFVPAHTERADRTNSGPGSRPPLQTFESVPNAHFIARGDTGALLSDRSCSDMYQPHQNADLFDTVHQYVNVDPGHWKLSTVGAIGNGARVFFTAEYNGQEHTVAGDKFKFYLLATTAHDMSGASIYQGSTIRVLCNNTFMAATAHPKGIIRVSHKSAFDKVRASKELAEIIQSFDTFKRVGDAMLAVHFAKEETSKLFKALLDIPFDAKREDVSTRKLNQFTALNDAYADTIREGTDRETVWTTFNAVTRYVDHARSTRGGDSVEEARLQSSQFGSGAALKSKAWDLLLPLVKDKVLVAS